MPNLSVTMHSLQSTMIQMKRPQKGFYLVFTAVLLVAIISMIALAIETGRIFLIARNLQQAADASALAGAQRLRKCDVDIDESTPVNFNCAYYSASLPDGIGGWQAVKPAVLTVLNDFHLPGGAGVGNISFNSEPTRCDINDTMDGFGDLRFENGGDGQFLSVRVERMFECADDTVPPPLPVPLAISLYSLEKSSYDNASPFYHYCYANAVRVTLSYTGLQMILGRFIGAPSTVTITKRAVARMRPLGAKACAFPLCSRKDNIATRVCDEIC